MRGRIVRIVEDRGFGFIKPDAGGANIFFHCSDLNGLEFSPQLVQLAVEFEPLQTEKGIRATGVRKG